MKEKKKKKEENAETETHQTLTQTHTYWEARHVFTTKKPNFFFPLKPFKCEINNLVFKLKQNRISILYRK